MVTTRTGPKTGLQDPDRFFTNCLNGKLNFKGVTLHMLNTAITLVEMQLNEITKESNTDWSKVQDTLDTLIAERYLMCQQKEGTTTV